MKKNYGITTKANKRRIHGLIGATAAILILGSLSGTALAASAKAVVQKAFEAETPICQVISSYMDECDATASTAARVAAVEGKLPRSLKEGATVVIKGKGIKETGSVLATGGIEQIKALGEEAAGAKAGTVLIWVDRDGGKAAVIGLEGKIDVKEGSKIKMKAKRRAPAVEGC